MQLLPDGDIDGVFGSEISSRAVTGGIRQRIIEMKKVSNKE